MEGVNAVLGIVEDDLVGYEKGLVCVRRAQTEQGEASRQTCHRTKKTLERLCHVMGDEVLVDLVS